MRMVIGRKPGEIMPIDLVDEYILGVNQKLEEVSVECDFLEEDSLHVNLIGGGFKPRDEEFAYWIARHVGELLNYGKDDGKEWVLYGEPNYWGATSDSGYNEVEELDEADTIQWMLYEETK